MANRTLPTVASPSRQQDRADRLYQLLRSSHLLASAVREVLDVQLLEEASPVPLSVSQFHILKLIARGGTHPVGHMAEFLGVSAPAASKAIDKLERAGFLVRSTSRDDRRVCLIEASEEGQALVRRHDQLTSERLAPILARFRSEEVDQLTSLTQRFALQLLDAAKGSETCMRCGVYVDDHCPVARTTDNCPYQKLRAAQPQ